jgi:GntR family histidine utilization transcriptional repressor
MKTDFRELKSELRQRIVGGTWKLGALLPNEVDLAAEYNCARATVNRAMRELAEEGLLERKRKAGTRVRQVPRRHVRMPVPLIRNEIEGAGSRYRYALLEDTIAPAPDWLRARLSLHDEAEVRHVRAMHYADGVPYQYEDRWFNLLGLPTARTPSFAESGAAEWFVSEVPFSDVEMSLSAQIADADMSGLLGTEVGAALFRIERAVWAGEVPVNFTRLLYRQGYNLSMRY